MTMIWNTQVDQLSVSNWKKSLYIKWSRQSPDLNHAKILLPELKQAIKTRRPKNIHEMSNEQNIPAVQEQSAATESLVMFIDKKKVPLFTKHESFFLSQV